MRLPVVILLFLLGSCSVQVIELPVQVERVADTRTLPQQCAHLLREPDPATWDEEKEEYPPNYAWEECMGVERKSRVM